VAFMHARAHQIAEDWIITQFQIHEERKQLRKYRMCCFVVAANKLTEGEPILSYDIGMAMCDPINDAFPGLLHWLEPVF